MYIQNICLYDICIYIDVYIYIYHIYIYIYINLVCCRIVTFIIFRHSVCSPMLFTTKFLTSLSDLFLPFGL